MNDNEKQVLTQSLLQVDRLEQIHTALRAHIKEHGEAYDEHDEEMIRIFVMLSEAITKQLGLSVSLREITK